MIGWNGVFVTNPSSISSVTGAESTVGVNGKKGASWGGRTHANSTIKATHSGNKIRSFIGSKTIIPDCFEWILYSYDRGVCHRLWKRCNRWLDEYEGIGNRR